MEDRQLYVLGDIHGQLDRFVGLLEGAGLLDLDGKWSGGESTLVLMGDFLNRGPDGLGVVEVSMALQERAKKAGGEVIALLGNHEVLLLSAYFFGRRPTTGPGGTFLADWKMNGGVEQDLDGLTREHVSWLTSLPAMVRAYGLLLAHADAAFYSDYGRSVDEVNGALETLLHGRDMATWDRLLGEFAERLAFFDTAEGTRRLGGFLDHFGARKLVHGHTPVCLMTGQSPEEVDGPLQYADRRCVNVDAGLYLGGPGFVYRPRSLPGGG